MPKTPPKKPAKTVNNITPAAREALARIKDKTGIGLARAIERAVLLFETQLNKGTVL